MCRTSWTHVAISAGLMLSMGMAPALGATPESPAQSFESDGPFLKQALGVNALELRLGHLATERATTSEVKAMGQRMVLKHTQIGEQLTALAKQSGVSGSAELSPDQQETLARVEGLSGIEFDSAFKAIINDVHLKEFAMYRDEVSRAANPQLRVLAEQRVAALSPAPR